MNIEKFTDKTYIIVLYLRISVEDTGSRTGDKDESNSISNQRDLLHDFIDGKPEFKDCTIVELFDDGYTGTNFERPAVKELLKRAKEKTVDCIIVKDFSRFGRDYLTVSDYVDQIFPFLGVRFISVNDGYDSAEYDGTTSGVDVAFRNVVYSYYSKDISEKVRSGRRTKALKGDYISAFAPIGYRKDRRDKNHLVVDEASAEIVRRIFRLAGTGMSALQISRLLNAEKVPTPSELKQAQGLHHKWWDGVSEEKIWDDSTLRNILRDERYLGKTVFGKRYCPEVGSRKSRKNGKDNWIIVSDRHEPLVTPEEFQAAQEIFKEYVEIDGQSHAEHLFTGKIRCGVCRYALTRVKKPTPRYQCTTKYRTAEFDCMNGHIKETDLAEIVWQAVVHYCTALLKIQKRIEKQKKSGGTGDLQKQLAAYQSAILSIDEQKAVLYEKLLDGAFDREQYGRKRDTLTKQQEDLQREISKLEEKLLELRQQASTAAPQTRTLQEYLQADGLTREMVKTFVDCIYVYSDQSIHIEWRFDDKGETNEQ